MPIAKSYSPMRLRAQLERKFAFPYFVLDKRFIPRVFRQSFPQGTLSPQQVFRAYGLPQKLQVKPVKIGVVSLGGSFDIADAQMAFQAWGLPAPNVTAIATSGASQSPDPGGANVENALDVLLQAAAWSWMTGLAADIVFCTAPNSGTGIADGYWALVNAGCGCISISWGCYDSETEILTQGGWRYFSELVGDEIVATLNPGSGRLEYQEIQKLHRYLYKGKLHSYRGRCTDLVVTPNHKMYLRMGYQGRAGLVSSDDVFGKSNYFVPKTAAWCGKDVSVVDVAGRTVKADSYLEFLGYFLSEGWATVSKCHQKKRVGIKKYSRLMNRRRHADGTYAKSVDSDKRELVERRYVFNPRVDVAFAVGICQTKNSEYIRRIDNCLKSLPFCFRRSGRNWKCSDRALCDYLSVFGKAHEKYVPRWIMELGPRQLRIFYDALMLGDGTRSPAGKCAYYTSSRRLADDVQEILLKLGFVGSIRSVNRVGRRNSAGVTRHIEYRVNIKEKYKTERLSKHTAVDYDGFVYCVTVPNHILFVRRNGMPAWCGNSPGASWSGSDRSYTESKFSAGQSKGVWGFAASGDNSLDDQTSNRATDYPCSSVYIVAGGGTRLVLNADGTIKQELAWGDGNPGDAGGGGGFDPQTPRPSWQVPVIPSTYPNIGRGVPDISGNADPVSGWQIVSDGQWVDVGGTSAVAPFYAGVFAAIKGAMQFKGLPIPNNLVQALYANPAMFNDIVLGSNGDPARDGWDDSTGMGSIKGDKTVAYFLGATPPPSGGPTEAKVIAAVDATCRAAERYYPIFASYTRWLNAQIDSVLQQLYASKGAPQAIVLDGGGNQTTARLVASDVYSE